MRTDVIEKAAKAIWDAPGPWTELSQVIWNQMSDDAQEHTRMQARAAFAVFEQAQAEPDWEYGRTFYDEAGDPHTRRISAKEYREHHPDGHRADGTPYWNYKNVRRRKAGPWEPVADE